MTVEYVDLSGWQGHAVDMQAVADAGIAGAWIKATQGAGYASDNFLELWIFTRAVGMKPGAYHFLERDIDPEAQARHFLDVYGQVSHVGALPLVLDVERAWSQPHSDDRCAEACLVWLRAVRAALPGAPVPLLYTYTAFARMFHEHPDLAQESRLLLADYRAWGTGWPTPQAPWTEVAAWQYTGSGRVPGINGNADRSRARVAL